MGLVLRQKKKYEESINHFLKAIELNPTFSSPYLNLGLLFEDTQEWERAIHYF